MDALISVHAISGLISHIILLLPSLGLFPFPIDPSYQLGPIYALVPGLSESMIIVMFPPQALPPVTQYDWRNLH